MYPTKFQLPSIKNPVYLTLLDILQAGLEFGSPDFNWQVIIRQTLCSPAAC